MWGRWTTKDPIGFCGAVLEMLKPPIRYGLTLLVAALRGARKMHPVIEWAETAVAQRRAAGRVR